MRLFRKKKPQTPKPVKSQSITSGLPDANSQPMGKRELALHHLSRFGWLTLRQVGQLLYGENSRNPHARGYKNARKIVRKLYDDRLIYVRILPNDSRAYLLTRKGASHLTRLTGKKAQHGENILKSHPTIDRNTGKRNGPKCCTNHWLHRWVSNQFVIENDVRMALTEVEIYRRNAPFPRQLDARDGIAKPAQAWREKIPDALLLRHDNDMQYLSWIEIENARRRHGDSFDRDHGEHPGSLESLALWLHNAHNEDVIHNRVRIERFVFVIVTRPGESSRKRQLLDPIIRAIAEHARRFIESDSEGTSDDFMPPQIQSLYDWIEVQEYVLGKGPQVLAIHSRNSRGLPQTLADVIEEFNLEDMQKLTGYD